MEPPYLQRAKAFKSELFDSAGVEEKLLQKENEFMDLKKNMKLKVWLWQQIFFVLIRNAMINWKVFERIN